VVVRGGSPALRVGGRVEIAIAGLAGLMKGRILVGGVDVSSDPVRAGRLVSYMPQDSWSRVPHTPVTPLELLELHSSIAGPLWPGWADEALEMVGVGGEAKRTPLSRLSPGMRQRVFLAMALLSGRPVVLLDEPLSAVDPEGRLDVLREDILSRVYGGLITSYSGHLHITEGHH